MKYLCLVYLEASKLHAVADRECMACGDGLRHSGRRMQRLEPNSTSNTIGE